MIYFFSSGLTLNCQFLQIFTSFNKIDYLDFFLESLTLISFKSIFLSFIFFLFFFMLSLIPLSAFHCLNPVGFLFPSFLIFSKMQKCKCYAPTMLMKCYDCSYRCDIQTLCPNMLLIDS